MTGDHASESPPSEHDWLLIETLERAADGSPSVPTLVADGPRVKDWVSLLRPRRELHAAAPQWIEEVVRRCVATAEPISNCESGFAIVGVPVRCAFGEVHGVQVWVGPVDAHPAPRPRVAAWDWVADTELAHHGPGLEELIFARAPQEVRVIRTPPEAFGRMVRFDGRLDYFDMVGKLDGRHQSAVDMIGDDDVVRSFQMVTRADPVARRVRALMHECTDVAPARPDVDMTMLRAVAQRADDGVGFVWLSTGLIYEWTRIPAPPLDRWAVERPTVHPDDIEEFRTACADLAGTTAIELRLRVRFLDSEWIPVRAELRPVVVDASGHGLLRVWAEPTD
ncbi:GAF domain-containing protein [Nocardia altamirensis]|uniref:GAF domain-containing protein n=1 Tax=Nocardia altamirensis TaxID=472158 RepID=UPI00084072EE|nr:GAF domain-containing protein [Nocardia altamirensis]